MAFGLTTLPTLSAVAGTFEWPGVLNPGFDEPPYRRPKEDGTGLVDQGPVGYQALSLFVDKGGAYVLESDQTVFEVWNGFIAVYAGSFDPRKPLENLVAANDDGPGGVGSSRLEVPLAPGVIYRVVTAFAEPTQFTQSFVNRIAGPGSIRPSACFPIDEVAFSDSAVDLSLSRKRVCISARWTDFKGTTGIGHPTAHRSIDAGMFWFFEPSNWELLVKVIDGCPVNGHLWLFLAGTTNVGFTVEAVLQDAPVFQQRYSNEVNSPAKTVLDTEAFPCEVLE